MNKKNKKYLWPGVVLICLASFGAMTLTGCAGKTKTSTVTTTSGVSGVGETTSVTTEHETVTDAHPRGVIGGIFYTIGQVLLWPFKVIGSLF